MCILKDRTRIVKKKARGMERGRCGKKKGFSGLACAGGFVIIHFF
jgi:hypothetical protein